MTPPDDTTFDDRSPLDPDELAVHAVLDAEADADQRRRVARQPALIARVGALRSVADTIATDVPPAADDVLARLRARALEAGSSGADDGDQTAADAAPDLDARDLPPSPADDLSLHRARRRRRGLPPLPAVAAVVLLLVLFGGALILTDRGSDDAAQTAADAGDSAEVADDGGSGESSAAGDGDGVDLEAAQAELRAEASASFSDDDALLASLRTVDPETLDDLATASDAPLASADAAPTTTAPRDDAVESGDVPDHTRAAPSAGSLSVTDPTVLRCDTVLRSTDENIGAAQAAAIVLVDGDPVLVLSNPVAASADAEASTRLTIFDPISCVPGPEAVQR